MKEIQGGICAAKGFKANGIHCGIRKNKSKRDLSLVVSDVRAAAAAVYTTNLVKGAPILVNQKHLADGYAQAIICNSGIANTCNANGVEMAEEMGKLVEKATGVKSDDVVIASTGVIGMPLNVTPIANGMDELVAGLGYDNNSLAAEGIMTTDTKKKETAVSFEIDGVECRIGGMAKGSGMIHPNMATMLVFVTSDVAITSEMLQKAVSDDVKTSFNMISVDGDTSTNDTFAVLANGMAGNKLIDSEGEAYDTFCEALHKVSVDLSRKIAGDGEGATKLLECKVTGGKTDEIAKKVAKSVICSSLTKAAMFGADANWGRVLCAIGYSGADVDIEKINVSFKSAKGTIEVCRNGAGVDFSEEKAKEILLENEIDILVDLNDGDFDATAWGCDLTYEYVKINGDYRT